MQYLRGTPAGDLLHLVGFRASLQYPEETKTFETPSFTAADHSQSKAEPANDASPDPVDIEKTATRLSNTIDAPENEIVRQLSSRHVTNPIIVSWYGDNDQENPRNWSQTKKSWVMFIMILYSFVVYGASSIVTPATQVLMQRYSVSIDVAYLTLSLYVLGYAIGPSLFSPISEIAFIGRNPPYYLSFILFVIVSIIIAVIDNISGIVVLRFFQGFFGSPILASGGATIDDIFDSYESPYGYVLWINALYCGPAIAPLMAAYAVDAYWRWPFWEIVIMAAIVLALLPFMPETSHDKIILERAKRLRKTTGNDSYMAPSELKKLHLARTFKQALIKPLQISIFDPAVGFVCIYAALIYATYYSFFEAFPIVYLETYRMSLGELGLIFLSIAIGAIAGGIMYIAYMRYSFLPKAKRFEAKNGAPIDKEEWLRPGLWAVFGPPIGLFLFAWTARASIHWIVPTIGIAIFCAGSFIVFQAIICYVPLTYPKYVASLFAANDLVRSTTAAAFVSFSRYMYINLGIDRGVTLVGGLSVLGVFGLFYLYYFGARLRARSRFAE